MLTPPHKWTAWLRRFGRAERGATAVEFALVSVPLLMLILGTLELAMVILVITSLETATEYAGRRIRTGEFQTGGANSKADFAGLVCQQMGWLQAQCATSLTVDVRVFNDFQSLAANQPIPPGNFNGANPPTCFAPGQPGDIVLVRAYFNWPLIAPVLSLMNNSGGGMRVVSSATAFRNEPYNNNPPGGAAC
jgi:Flp pilus assembly protein TadG